MAQINETLTKIGFAARGAAPDAWRVSATKAPSPSKPGWRRLFGRREPTTFQRCLAIHMLYAGPRSGLS